MVRKPVPIISEDEGDDGDLLSNISVQQADAPPARSGKAVPKLNMPSNKGVKTLRILLEENADIPPSGQFIGHNGNSYLLKPGVWVDVPLPLIEVLNNAVAQVPERDPQTQQITGWREKLRYPYRVAPGQMAA